jgi:hypothetical protein
MPSPCKNRHVAPSGPEPVANPPRLPEPGLGTGRLHLTGMLIPASSAHFSVAKKVARIIYRYDEVFGVIILQDRKDPSREDRLVIESPVGVEEKRSERRGTRYVPD